ncbi:hypothetical protein ACLK19_28130 [Escherichia coli]
MNEATHRYLFWTSDVRADDYGLAAGNRPGSAPPHLAGRLVSWVKPA